MRTTLVLTLSCLVLFSNCRSVPVAGQEIRHRPKRLEFNRMFAHWAGYADPGYLEFIEAARPQLVQLGFYGAHFWSLAHTPAYGGYPAHFPVRGLSECGEWFAQKNAALRERNVRVIGHFNIEFLVGDPEGPDGPTGFFRFYRDLWNEEELGPRPVDDPIELLERGPDGNPIGQAGYGIGGMREYWACLRNPGWQSVLKAWVRRGIERGLDGFIVNYFYRHNCLCEHCQGGFRRYLTERFSAAELQSQFGISDVQSHRFSEIVFWHDVDESTPLRREMLRWSQISNKQVFDHVFLEHGRKLKPDLIVAQWNHLSDFSQIRGDERCLLPADLWGRGEDYLWYSTGAAAFYTDLKKGFLGEGTLQARYIRGAFDDRPFTLGKYENTRIRVAIAELAANGGAPMGFYARFTDPETRAEIVRYYRFLERYDDIFRANRSHAESVLLFPRSQVHAGNISAVEQFRQLGKRLLDEHVLFDILPDDILTAESEAGYDHVVSVDDPALSAVLSDAQRSRFELDDTVRVSASQPADGRGVAIHLVNYNRIEPPPDRKGRPAAGRGIADEKPVRTRASRIRFRLPDDMACRTVEFLTPEQPDAVPLVYSQDGRFISCEVPPFLVYGIVRVRSDR